MGSSPVFGIFILHQYMIRWQSASYNTGRTFGAGRYFLLKKVLILILFILLPATGFSLDDTKYIYNNPNVPVEVRVGDEFSIALPSNPTTGYKWELLKPFDDDVLELQDAEYTSECKDGLVGCGGVEVWNFFAASEGEATISLKYARPWEKNVKPIQTRVFKVIVNP